MVNVMLSGPRGLGNQDVDGSLCCRAKHFNLAVLLSTQE